jgi:hypothetical protein
MPSVPTLLRTLLPTALVATFGAIAAPTAMAADVQPCGSPVNQSWSTEKVQPCPLTGGLAPNGWVPIYRQPTGVAAGATAPRPDGWLHGTSNQFFVCDAQVSSASYTHPNGARNDWWAYTQADGSDMWGWVPEAFFAGGGTDEPDAALKRCPSSPPRAPTVPKMTDPLPPAPTPVPTPDPGTGVGDQALDQSCAPEPTVTTAADLLTRSRVIPARRGRRPGAPAMRLTVHYGSQAEVVGTLADPSGAPMPDVPLCLVSRPDLDDAAPYLELARTTTDANGNYTASVPSGPSREILVIYRSGDTAVVGRTVVKVIPRVSASPNRRVLRNRQTLRISGRLSGGPFPRRGVIVGLQAIRNGEWAGFDDPIRTDSEGRYHFTHRFEFTSFTQTYSLRTRVPAQTGYPYVTGTSKRLQVRVRGAG